MLASLLVMLLAGDPAAPAMSPQGRALFAEVRASIETVRARHAALPPAPDDGERLRRMGEIDQAPRKVVTGFDVSKIPAAEREAVVRAAVAPMEAADRENQQALLAMIPPEGWFLKSRYGEAAARAAFQVVQHGDLSLQNASCPAWRPC